ncbi:MAG: AI-2E family transporter [Firmicutes bacterium]|nr:AI-2E family transporter [Bacillota bacterium]
MAGLPASAGRARAGRWHPGRVLALAGFGLALLVFLYLVRRVLPPFLGALALVYLLNPAVAWLQKRGLGRTVAIAAVYAVVAALTAGFLLVYLPRLVAEVGAAAAQLPFYAERLSRWASDLQGRLSPAWLPAALRVAVNDVLLAAQGAIINDARETARGVVSAAPVLASLLLSPFLAYFLLRDLEAIKAWLFCLVPWHLTERGWQVVAEMDRAVGGFFRGQVVVAGLVGTLVAAAMFLLGMPFPLLLGLVAGLTDLIPYFGPVLGGIPAALLALTRGPVMVLKVVLVLALIQQLEAGFLSPRVVGQRTGLHPVLVAGAVLSGGYLGGFTGMILAVPVAGALRPLLSLAYQRLVDNPRA